MLGIIGLILGIAALIFISYRGLHATPTSLICSIIIVVLNGINLWTGASTWVAGLAAVFTGYYLLFLFSTLYANVMQETHACNAIAYKLMDWFGKKHILTVLIILSFLLCYGGVSFFVIMFAVGPICFAVFKEVNAPRYCINLVVSAGVGAFVLAAPGTTQIQNVIPTALGTDLWAAGGLGWIMTGVGLIASIVIAELWYKKIMKRVEAGEIEGYTPHPAGTDAPMVPRDETPNALCGFLPIVVVIALVLAGSLGKWFGGNATNVAIFAMLCGTIVCVLLNIGQFKKEMAKNNMTTYDMFKKITASAATQAAGSALTLGSVVGFGTIVSSTAAFASIVQWLMGLNMSTYWKGIFATGVLAGVCGSASSGSKLTMQYLAEYFMSTGANMPVLHRLIANASITFDALPHATGCFLMFSYFGVNHKNSYKYVWWLNVVLPVVIVVIFTAICSAIY